MKLLFVNAIFLMACISSAAAAPNQNSIWGTYEVQELHDDGVWRSCFEHQLPDPLGGPDILYSFKNLFKLKVGFEIGILNRYKGSGCLEENLDRVREIVKSSQISVIEAQESLTRYSENVKTLSARTKGLTKEAVDSMNNRAVKVCGLSDWKIGQFRDNPCFIKEHGHRYNGSGEFDFYPESGLITYPNDSEVRSQKIK